jgi:hypothetical protein
VQRQRRLAWAQERKLAGAQPSEADPTPQHII